MHACVVQTTVTKSYISNDYYSGWISILFCLPGGGLSQWMRFA